MNTVSRMLVVLAVHSGGWLWAGEGRWGRGGLTRMQRREAVNRAWQGGLARPHQIVGGFIGSGNINIVMLCPVKAQHDHGMTSREPRLLLAIRGGRSFVGASYRESCVSV